MNAYIPSWPRREEPTMRRSRIHHRAARMAVVRNDANNITQQQPKQPLAGAAEPINHNNSNNTPVLLVLPTPCSYQTALETLKTIHFGYAPPRSSSASRNFDANALEQHEQQKQQTLPTDVVTTILSFLTVHRVQSDQVEAVNCSSHDGVYALSECLEDRSSSENRTSSSTPRTPPMPMLEGGNPPPRRAGVFRRYHNHQSWWMAERGSMPHGRGREWVQFRMAPGGPQGRGGVCRRVKKVSLKVPPMPDGPLAVRTFCLEAPTNEDKWQPVSPVFTVSPHRMGWQRFEIPGELEVAELRLVCLTNQFQVYVERLRRKHPQDEYLQRQLRRFESIGFFAVQFD